MWIQRAKLSLAVKIWLYQFRKCGNGWKKLRTALNWKNCVGGGGQPIHDGEELARTRGENLYFLDKNAPLRFSHENPDVLRLYRDFFEKPLSHKSHMLLHTDHNAWEMPR